MSQGNQTQESFIGVAPSQTIPGAQNVRQLLVFEFQPATGTYVQVQTEVVVVADPVTGMPAQLATSDQLGDVVGLLRANLRATVTILNEMSATTSYTVDEFMREEEEV